MLYIEEKYLMEREAVSSRKITIFRSTTTKIKYAWMWPSGMHQSAIDVIK